MNVVLSNFKAHVWKHAYPLSPLVCGTSYVMEVIEMTVSQ